MEDYWLGYATERIFLPLVRVVLPEVVDYHMPPEGVFHNLVFVAINKQFPGHAYKVGYGLLGLGLLMLAKVIVVVDADVNVKDSHEAWWAALNNIDPQRDLIVLRGPTDELDHAAKIPAYGGKLVVDATTKWGSEGFTRPWPTVANMSEDIRRLVDEKWDSYGI